MTPVLDVDGLLDNPETRIIVCCGSGGVGKTTTAASLALRAAERGRKVVVLTIDPARRLAQSMGIEQLDNVPRRVQGVVLTSSTNKDGSTNEGCLDATMLDMKSTFDEVVLSQTTPEKAQKILDNPFYISLSSSFAGTQEYMAMEKLGQLHTQAVAEGTYDLIVVDTPPSRSALDFLDAPERLASFLDGRFIRLLMVPARGTARFFTLSLGVVTNALTTILGAQVLRDMQDFVAALDTLFGGFRQRAESTFALLQAEGTAFVVVATPDADALGEAAYFLTRLREEGMPLAGVVVNRMNEMPMQDVSVETATDAANELDALEPDSIAAGLLRLYADQLTTAEAQTKTRQTFLDAHPDVPIVSVPAMPSDVHDLDGLRLIAEMMAKPSQ